MQSENEKLLLHTAAFRGDLPKVNGMYSIENYRTLLRVTPLYLAAANGQNILMRYSS